MLFNSFEFLLIFLPITLIGFQCLRRMWPAAVLPWLIVASLYFYASHTSWHVLLLIGSLLGNYVLARYLRRSRWFWPLGFALNLLPLMYFKYSGFVLELVGAPSHCVWEAKHWSLPLAISFFSFQQLTFLHGIRKGALMLPPFVHYSAYISFFPQLIAGPIVKPEEFLPQLKQAVKTWRPDGAAGCVLITLGLAKKVLIADPLGAWIAPVFSAASGATTLSALEVTLATLGFTFQIYFDFSAYSEIAMGVARLFGLKLPINFWSPFHARSISEFWRRWHLTLSRLLRDYLYIPLGGNRHGLPKQIYALMLTMLIGGLWHGAGWQFLVWGGLHGVYMTLETLWKRTLVPRGFPAPPKWLQIGLTFAAVTFAFLFFRVPDMPTAWSLLGAFTQPEQWLPANMTWPAWSGIADWLRLTPLQAHVGVLPWSGMVSLLLAAALIVLPYGVWEWLGESRSGFFPSEYRRYFPANRAPVKLHPWHGVLLGLVFVLVLASLGQLNQFIYFQF